MEIVYPARPLARMDDNQPIRIITKYPWFWGDSAEIGIHLLQTSITGNHWYHKLSLKRPTIVEFR
jgi:hypothetical protein